MFETLFLASITATKNIFYLVGFLAPWFLTKISSKKVNHKNARIFLPYVAPSLSSAAYLPLPLPTTTCRCLPLPATKSLPATTCNYLLRPATTSTYHYLPLPAAACQGLPLPVSIWPSSTTSIGHHLQISTYPQTHSLRLHRLKLNNRPRCQTTLIGSSWKTLSGKEYLLFGLFFETLVFGQQHLPKMSKKDTFFGQKRSEKTVRCKWPTLSRGGPLCDSIRHCKL